MKLNKRIITVMTAVLALFLVIVIYLTYFTIFRAGDIVNSTYNQRVWEKEERILRGTIYDRKGVTLAKSEQEGDSQKRIYPFGKLYAHTIGYNSRTYGKTSIELKFNSFLLKTQSVIDVLKKENNDKKEFSRGADLALTLDNGMTKLAAELLGNDNGSVVALNPVTGEVYCLYSNPSFDPNEDALTKNWDTLSGSSDAPFLSRATQGLYAPGSTFKVISAAAGIEAGYQDFITEDGGKTKVGGKEFKNAGEKAYGNIDISDAIRYSSNVYFTELSEKIGNDLLQETADNFCLSTKIPFDIETKAVKNKFGDLDSAHLASVAIGQGALQVTPLHMALVASGVANDGVIMRPYIVEKAFYDGGNIIYKAPSDVLSEAIDTDTAKMLTEYMKECVASGTGTAAHVSGTEVAGKTGTAENERAGKTHAWFIGFAPADNPQIALCVMKEYSGRGGGSVCAPVARRIISYALENGLIEK